MKLFQCVGPQVAVFGKKDYQQQMVIRQMCEQFSLPTEIIAAETIRDHDGLALSSRNGYLSASERAQAPSLYERLHEMRSTLLALGSPTPQDCRAIEAEALTFLTNQGWTPDYLSIRLRRNLRPPSAEDLSAGAALVILAAARLGSTRLIDNLEV